MYPVYGYLLMLLPKAGRQVCRYYLLSGVKQIDIERVHLADFELFVAPGQHSSDLCRCQGFVSARCWEA